VKEALLQLIGIAMVLAAAAGLVYVLADLVPQKAVSVTETNFRAACASAKGTTVWTGKSWDCIK